MFSQVQQSDSGTTIDNVDIITIYKPDVAESVKIEIEPKLVEPKHDPFNYNYSFPDVSYQPKAVYSPIDPIYLKPEKDRDYYDNYFQIGGGNYGTSFIDAQVFNTQDKYYTYGLRVKHHASSFSNNPNQGLFSENRITAFGKREKGGTLSGEIDYKRNVVHYYGYVDSTELTLDDINQIYNDINAHAKWLKNANFGQSSLKAGFDIFDRLSGNEFTVNLENQNEFKIGSGSTFFLDLGVNYNSIKRDVQYNRFYVDAFPHYKFKQRKYIIDIGLKTTFFNDSNTSVLYFAPHLDAHTYLVPDKLKAYLGVTGGLQKNSMRDMTNQNLFLGNDAEFRNPFEQFHIYAGMNGHFKRFVEYGIRLSQKVIHDQFFFVNDTNRLRNLTTVYDSVGMFSFSGELKLDINRNLDLGFAATVYSYNLNNQKNAWHAPSYDAKAFVTLRLAEKLYISAAYFAIGPRTAVNLRGEQTSLNAINDINLGAEYRYKKNISAFLNLQNVLNQKYQIWNRHNAQGFNVLAGVTFSI
ncbi:MAG: hypothetical protein JXR19_01115 [Bacteroidia bacterium]